MLAKTAVQRSLINVIYTLIKNMIVVGSMNVMNVVAYIQRLEVWEDIFDKAFVVEDRQEAFDVFFNYSEDYLNKKIVVPLYFENYH